MEQNLAVEHVHTPLVCYYLVEPVLGVVVFFYPRKRAGLSDPSRRCYVCTKTFCDLAITN